MNIADRHDYEDSQWDTVDEFLLKEYGLMPNDRSDVVPGITNDDHGAHGPKQGEVNSPGYQTTGG